MAGFQLQLGEMGHRAFTPEAAALGPRHAPRFQPETKIAPASTVDATELTGGPRVRRDHGALTEHAHAVVSRLRSISILLELDAGVSRDSISPAHRSHAMARPPGVDGLEFGCSSSQRTAELKR